jgi:hypothetical protein
MPKKKTETKKFELLKEDCSTCRYGLEYVLKKNAYQCRRYPKWDEFHELHWCGEYKNKTIFVK